MIKSQQLSLRNDAARKLLGLPDTRAQVGYRAQKSPLEVPEMMQACPSTLCALVIFIMCNWIMMLKLSWIYRGHSLKMLTCKWNRCHLIRELPVRVQLLILQWKVWKEIYLCPVHLRSYLKYECLHNCFVLEYCSGMNSDAYTYMFITSKHYSIWGLAAEIKLFHWSGKLVLCFV